MSAKDKILKIFSLIREDNSLPWEEKDFMEFLIKSDGKTIDNSFKGKRYKNKFLNQIQMEFAICFPNDFYENKWGLNKFAEYVEQRASSVEANLKMAKKRLNGSKRADINAFIFLNLLFVPPFFLLQTPYNWFYLLLPVVLNGLLIRFKIADVIYHKRLVAKISGL